jgi:hypothetical protein
MELIGTNSVNETNGKAEKEKKINLIKVNKPLLSFLADFLFLLYFFLFF